MQTDTRDLYPSAGRVAQSLQRLAQRRRDNGEAALARTLEQLAQQIEERTS